MQAYVPCELGSITWQRLKYETMPEEAANASLLARMQASSGLDTPSQPPHRVDTPSQPSTPELPEVTKNEQSVVVKATPNKSERAMVTNKIHFDKTCKRTLRHICMIAHTQADPLASTCKCVSMYMLHKRISLHKCHSTSPTHTCSHARMRANVCICRDTLPPPRTFEIRAPRQLHQTERSR